MVVGCRIIWKTTFWRVYGGSAGAFSCWLRSQGSLQESFDSTYVAPVYPDEREGGEPRSICGVGRLRLESRERIGRVGDLEVSRIVGVTCVA